MTSARAERRLLPGVLLTFAGQLGPLIAGIVALPLIVRGLGVERFGLLSLGAVVLGHLALFDVGLGRAVAKWVAEHVGRRREDEIPAVVWSAAATQAVAGLLGGVALVALTPWLVGGVLNIPPAERAEARWMLYVFASAVPLAAMSTSFQGLLEGLQRFGLATAVTAPFAAATFLLPLVGLALGFGLPGIAALAVVARGLGLITVAVAGMTALPTLRRVSVDRRVSRDLLRFGGWVTLSSLVGPVLVYLDRLLIASLGSTALVAFYTAPWEIATRLWIVPCSAAVVLFPAVSRLHVEGSALVEGTAGRAVRGLLLVLAPVVVVLVVFASPILGVWLGDEFALRSATVLQILGAAVLVNSLAQVPYAVLQASGRPDIPAKLHLLEVAAYPFLAWWLIRDFGIVGAAWACALRVTVDATLLFAAASRVTGIRRGAAPAPSRATVITPP